MEQLEITFSQAVRVAAEKDNRDRVRFVEILEEVDTSDPMILDSQDFDYYASILSETNPSGKTWSANEIRRRMASNNEIDPFAMLSTFGMENDDMMDFY